MHFYQYGLVDIYLILWVISKAIAIYFVLKLFHVSSGDFVLPFNFF